MPTLYCPNCGKKSRAPESAIGKTGRCQFCQTTMVIPAEDMQPPEQAAASRPGPAAAAAPLTPTHQEPPSNAPAKPTKIQPRTLVIGAVVLCGVLGVLLYGLGSSRRPAVNSDHGEPAASPAKPISSQPNPDPQKQPATPAVNTQAPRSAEPDVATDPVAKLAQEMKNARDEALKIVADISRPIDFAAEREAERVEKELIRKIYNENRAKGVTVEQIEQDFARQKKEAQEARVGRLRELIAYMYHQTLEMGATPKEAMNEATRGMGTIGRWMRRAFETYPFLLDDPYNKAGRDISAPKK